MQSKEEFVNEVVNGALDLQNRYPQFRWGQSVFNYIESEYGNVARVAQFKKGIDCFYRDEFVMLFIEAVYNILKEWEENCGESVD